MGVTNSNKELSTSKINCGDSFSLKLSITAKPDILTNPEDLSVSGQTDSMCGGRHFKARFIAHYVDSGFVCCQAAD